MKSVFNMRDESFDVSFNRRQEQKTRLLFRNKIQVLCLFESWFELGNFDPFPIFSA